MIKRAVSYLKTNFMALVALSLTLLVAYTFSSYIIIQRYDSRTYSIHDISLQAAAQDIRVGIVFGGGVHEEMPLPLLQDRLDAAYSLLDSGIIDKVLLSGDNRLLEYNEPRVMVNYLVEDRGVDASLLQPDYAGRSTYETCERANKVFKLEKAVLITESTHLPRALYLCEHFGVKAIGVKSDGVASSGLKIGQRWREVLARDKALLNVYFIGERTVLGDPIDVTY